MTKHPLFDDCHARVSLAGDIMSSGDNSPEAIRVYDAMEDLLIAIMANDDVNNKVEWLHEYMLDYAKSVEDNAYYRDLMAKYAGSDY